ncbi:MAG TPA: hypothetical protein VFI47_22180, partial [Acidimicrobiales bacterium]|nr:hypothetical protein [Acidimicrobiales bacterium]
MAQAAARAGARELDVAALRTSGVVRIDPVKARAAAQDWLKRARIEAIFCCQFLALLVGALIERQIRTAMHEASQKDIRSIPNCAH